MVSLIAGVLTYVFVAFALSFTQFTSAGWLFFQYSDVFGLASLAGHAVQTAAYSETDEFYGPGGRMAAFIVTRGVWTVVFGGLYFRFVFRPRPTI